MKSAAQEYVETLGKRLSWIRVGKSQAERATELGVHTNTYARWERGEASISAEGLIALMADGWSANWLLTGEGPEKLDAPQTSAGTETNSRVEESAPSHTLSAERLSIAIELAKKTLGDRWLPGPDYALLIGLMYEALQEGRTYSEILSSGLAIASRLFGEEYVDSEHKMGAPHSSGAGAVAPKQRHTSRQGKKRKAG